MRIWSTTEDLAGAGAYRGTAAEGLPVKSSGMRGAREVPAWIGWSRACRGQRPGERRAGDVFQRPALPLDHRAQGHANVVRAVGSGRNGQASCQGVSPGDGLAVRRDADGELLQCRCAGRVPAAELLLDGVPEKGGPVLPDDPPPVVFV